MVIRTKELLAKGETIFITDESGWGPELDRFNWLKVDVDILKGRVDKVVI